MIVPQREGAIGGADLHVLDLARQQKACGWYPRVFAPRASSQYVRLLREAGVDVLFVHTRQLRKLARLPSELGIDVVHAHGYESNYLVAALRVVLPAWRVVPTVITAHGWIETGPWLRMKSALDRLTARTAHVRIASARAHVGRMWTRRGENFVVHNGVPAPRTRTRTRRSVQVSRSLVVGSVGRLSPEKRVDLFLTAGAKVVAEGYDVRLLVVGGGNERAALEEMATSLGLSDRVSFTGLVDDPEPQYGEMDLLVQASDTEGTPRTVVEAMARHVPVVATRVGDVAEILEDGAAGMLVPPGDGDALAEAIQRVLSDRDLAEAVARRAEVRYRERYTIEAMARHVERCYDTAIRIARKTASGGGVN